MMKTLYIQLMTWVMLSVPSFGQELALAGDPITREVSEEIMAAYEGFDFFSSDELLQITISFDIREFLKSKSDPAYQDANLTIRTESNDYIFRKIRVKARGEMRRNYCSFPPIMLKFNKDDPEFEKIKGKGTLKLVTHCNLTPVFENYVFKEYLVYKMLNQVTPYSYRTRLVKIHYVDINKPEKSITAYGFLIENDNQMAERNNAVIIENPNISQTHMNPDDMARVAIFNYMIGNTDWSLPSQHNIKVLKPLEVQAEKGIPVAYDFDYSGFVNTSYSAPAKGLPIKSVVERHYLGSCYSPEELNPVIEQFEELKQSILTTVHDFEYLPKSSKKQLESFINGFYKENRFHSALLSDMNRTCIRF